MPINFYKKDGSYFNANDNSKILNPTDLQTLSKAGGKEISAPAPIQNTSGQTINLADPNYSVYKNQNPSSSTISAGISNSNIASNLPSSSDSAMKLYADNSLTDSTKLQSELQANLDKFNAQRVADNQNQLKAEQENLKIIQTQKDNQVAGYDSQMTPLKDKAVGIYDSMLNSIKDTNYSDLTKTKLELTNNIVSYSKLFSEEMAQAELGGGLSSVASNRKNQVIENYTSKIAIAEAASKAIDGNFTLAFDIMDKGANAIQNLTTDRINFINTVQSLFSNKETDSRNKILSLTSDQKTLLDNAKLDAQKKIDNLQANKKTIMDLFNTNPIIAYKAGLSLTDTPEQSTKKLNDLYVKYPQYTPDNQAFIKKAMEKYYDAGITLNDPLDTVQSKISQSKIYQKENQNNPITIKDSNGNDISVVWNPVTKSYEQVNATSSTKGVVVDKTGNAYDISSYATDPNHETAVQNIINGIGQFKSVSDIDNYIKSKYPNSPVTGQMIYNAAEKYGVSWEAMTAMMAQDSSMGTAGKGARTFNPGNVGNDDSGNIRNYGNWQSGVDAVAQWLSNHKTTAPIDSTVSNPKIDEIAKNYITTGAKLSDIKGKDAKETALIIQSYLKQKVNSGELSKTDAEINAKLQDKVTQIDDLIKQTGNSGAVGPNWLARTSLTSWMTGTRQAFVGSVKQLLSKETLDTLLNLKKGGGTLGALSDQERLMLQTAATKIGGWEMKDKNGNGEGFYNVNESDFKKELENIKELAKRAIKNAGGETGIINNLEQNLAANPTRVDEYNKLVADNPDLTEDDINQLMGFTK